MNTVRTSVIIPAKDAAATIGLQLQALASQVANEPFEVIVVDNGSTDETVAVCRSFEARIPGLRIISCARPGTSAARNAGAAVASGEQFLFCDADDEVSAGWVSAMTAALRESDAAGGAIENDRLNPGRPGYLPRHPDALPVAAGFLPRALTANLGVKREAFAAVGGFADDYVYGSDDTEFCWRLQLASFTLRYAPEAVVHYRHRDNLRALAVKSFRASRSRARLYRDYRAQGMPGTRLVGAARRLAQLAVAVPTLPFSARTRWWWVEAAAGAAGRLSGSLRYGVLYL